MEHIYPDSSGKESKEQAGVGDTSSGPHHKEEGKKRREMDADDRYRILLELSRTSHPLENQSPHLYNIVNGAFASPEAKVNVAESATIGGRMSAEFRASLPTRFHATISSPIKTIEHIKKRVKVGEKRI